MNAFGFCPFFLSLLLLVNLLALHTSSVDGAEPVVEESAEAADADCAQYTNCTACTAATNCSWFYCQVDDKEDGCGLSANSTGHDGCDKILNATQCTSPTKAPSTISTTAVTSTVSPPTNATTASTPTSLPTSTAAPSSTTSTVTSAAPASTSPASTTILTPSVEPKPSTTAAPHTGGFSVGSFFGGIVFCLVVLAAVYVGLRVYRQRRDGGRYSTL